MKTFKTIDLAFEDIPEGVTFNHEIIYYIERPLTLDEWIALDEAQSDAFEKVGISMEDVLGIAGPIPFPEAYEEMRFGKADEELEDEETIPLSEVLEDMRKEDRDDS